MWGRAEGLHSGNSLPRFWLASLVLLAGACKPSGENKRILDEITSFKTNGSLFAYSLLMSDGPALFLSGIDGNLREFKPPEDCYITYADVGSNRSIYTCYFWQDKITSIYECGPYFEDCRKILEKGGAIRNPVFFQNDDTIIFQHAPYDPETFKNSGYARFTFHKLSVPTGVVHRFTHPEFADTSLAIALKDRIVFGAIFGRTFRNEGPIISDREVVYSQDYFAVISDNNIKIGFENIELIGDRSLQIYLQIGAYNVYYGALHEDPKYIYYTCVLRIVEKQSCGGKTQRTSAPDVENGIIYYSSVDFENMRATIHQYNATSR
jgi:hypothetical protein